MSEKPITREDLEYMFNTATEKFVKEFQAAKVEPQITIQNATLSCKADVKKINKELAEMLQESADAVAGGCYSEKPCNPPKSTNEEIRETLQKQIQLLSERSEKPDSDLPALTHAIVEIVTAISSTISPDY